MTDRHTEREIEILNEYVEQYLQSVPWFEDELEHEKILVRRYTKDFARHLHETRAIILRESDIAK